MKNKIIKVIIMTIFIITLMVSFNIVKADNEVNKDVQQLANEDETIIQEPQTREVDEPATIAVDDVEWTDFSNAQFSLEKNSVFDALVEISGVTPRANSTYYLCVSDNSGEPTESFEGREVLSFDETSKTFKAGSIGQLKDLIERNKDIYVSVIEATDVEENVVIYGKKLDKFDEPKYSDAFSSTYITSYEDQIAMNFTHYMANNRKMQIKVGKITDTSILQKIKNKDSSGFSDLLSFARTSSGMFDEVVSAEEDDGDISYKAENGNSLISLNGLEDKAYYYLYVRTDDENGEYISNEAVTFAYASVYTDDWYMFFYDAENFNWVDFGEISVNSTPTGSAQDNTTAKGKIPQTGLYNYAIIGIIALGVIGVVSYKKYRKNNF